MTSSDIQVESREQAKAQNNYIECECKIKELLGSSEDIERYNDCLRKIIENEKQPANEFGLQQEFIFAKLPGVNVWSIGPPDILHDLPEGIDDRLLAELVLKDAISLPTSEIVDRIEKFNFYHGKFLIKYKEGMFHMKRSKAVQVVFFIYKKQY